MKLPWTKAKADTPALPSQVTGVIQGRPDHYTPYGTSLSYLPQPHDVAITAALRQAIPIMDAAIDVLVMLTGDAEVKWESDMVQEEWNAWAQRVKLAPLSNGFNSWLNGYQARMLQTGMGASELIIDGAGKDIWGFQYISTKSLRLQVNPENPVLVDVFQQQNAQPQPVRLDLDRLAVTPFNPRDDSPYGRSIYCDCPFVGEIILEVAHALKQNWQRVGAPSFGVTVDVPSGLDPSTDIKGLMGAMVESIKTAWTAAMSKRKVKGEITDFFGAGSINFKVIGADGQILDMQIPWRSVLEQIISVTHVPPFMLGLTWSTTERLSSEQAQCLERVIGDYQQDLTSVVLWVADWWARVRGYASAGRECVWPELGIRDRVQLAQARYLDAQAMSVREKNYTALWQKGVVDQQGYAVGVTEDEAIEPVTPMDEPPAPPAAPNPFGAGNNASGNSDNASGASNNGHVQNAHTHCNCGHIHKGENAHVSYGVESPNDPRVADTVDQMYGDLRNNVRAFRRRVWSILDLPEITDDNAARSNKADDEGDGNGFRWSQAQKDAYDRACDQFVAEMYGRDLSRAGFVSAETGDGIVQQYDVLAHSIGAQRVAEATGESLSVTTDRNSEAIQSLLESAFDRLSDSGQRALGEDVRSGIYQVIEEGMSLGSSPIAVARELSDSFDGYEGWQMERLARTEIAFAQNAGFARECESQGVDTSNVDMSALPAHPNCMCGYSITQMEDGTWITVYDVSAQACELCQEYATGG